MLYFPYFPLKALSNVKISGYIVKPLNGHSLPSSSMLMGVDLFNKGETAFNFMSIRELLSAVNNLKLKVH